MSDTAMTDTATDPVDLGRLAVIGEGFATPENMASVAVVSVNEAPEVTPDQRSWRFMLDTVCVVLADVSDGLGHPAGVVEHFAAELGVEAVELGSSQMVGAEQSVLLIEGGQGPALVGFISPLTPEGIPERRVEDADQTDGLLSLGILSDVPLDVSAELGHSRLSVAEILQLNVGSVIELDRTAGAPVDVVVNGSLIARGEVVVIDDEYGIRITEIVGRLGDVD